MTYMIEDEHTSRSRPADAELAGRFEGRVADEDRPLHPAPLRESRLGRRGPRTANIFQERSSKC